MQKEKIIYCELLTKEDVIRFEKLMMAAGVTEDANRPMSYAVKPPSWFVKGNERPEDEDPLAAIVIMIYPETEDYILTAGYRSTSGTEVSPDVMEMILQTYAFKRA